MTPENRRHAEVVRENDALILDRLHAMLHELPRREREAVQAGMSFKAEAEELREEVKQLRLGSLTTAYTFSHVVHAMRAAWIEWKHGRGAEAAMVWIENTLDGPDQIPQADDGTDAQAYFDRVMAEDRERETAGRASL